MKTNISVQSSVWQAAFAEGLARGEAAFGNGARSAADFAETYAFLVEAEQHKNRLVPDKHPSETSENDAKASWARAFRRLD